MTFAFDLIFYSNTTAINTSDATILAFGIRYNIDTILPKYRDIDTISIFYKLVKIVCSIYHTGGWGGESAVMYRLCVLHN